MTSYKLTTPIFINAAAHSIPAAAGCKLHKAAFIKTYALLKHSIARNYFHEAYCIKPDASIIKYLAGNNKLPARYILYAGRIIKYPPHSTNLHATGKLYTTHLLVLRTGCSEQRLNILLY